MNPIEILKNHIRRNHPGAEIELTRPLRKDGMWSLDVDLEDVHLGIQWSEGTPFGVSTATTDNFGEGPDETYDSVEAIRERVDELLTGVEQTAPSFGVLLSRLREQRGVTQQVLSERLGIKQSTLSGVERRDDVQISTVRRIVDALGGSLELSATFGDLRYRIDIPGASSRQNIRYLVSRTVAHSSSVVEAKDTFEALHLSGRLKQADRVATNISARGSVLEMV